MSCGCVPVAFAVGGIPEIVINGYNGVLVEPYSTESMAQNINDLYLDSYNPRESIVRRFDLLQMVTRFENIYTETLVRCGK
jgi:glycosyltransferase involved in cell wall biosynthesis